MKLNIPPLREGWTTFFLGWALVWIAAVALRQADVTNGLENLLYVGSLAYLAGMALARSRFTGGTAFIYMLVYGLFVIGWLLGRTFFPPELEMSWAERTTELVRQQAEWIGKLMGGGTSRNATIFVAHTAIIFWFLGYTAAWYTFRTLRVWRVILPSGIILLSVVYNYFGPKPLYLYMAAYLVVAMLYLSRTFLAEQEEDWRASAVRYERTTSWTFLRGGLLVATLLMLLASNLPTFGANMAVNDALGGVNRPWRQFQDNWTRLYASLQSHGGGVSDPFLESLALGGPRNVGEALIMDVYVEEQLPYAYWQSTVFQTYTDGQWRRPTGERILHVPDDGALRVPTTIGRQEVRHIVLNFLPNAGMLYGLPEMVQASRQMFVTRQLDERGLNLVSLIQSRTILQQGDQYEVVSRLSVADEQSLRSAGTLYPAWTVPYLQVPDSITAETRALAADLTTPYDNPYDQAIAVQNYLRANIRYNDQIAAPPNHVEPIHYVLFDLKEGYCNYYASAMVIMLRLQGVPARVVGGYAAGQFIEDANVYRVRAKDAHTWVEVYFPRYGWVPFEPTASISTIARPTGEVDERDPFRPNNESNAQLERDDILLDDELIDPNAPPEGELPASPEGTAEGVGGRGFSADLVWRMVMGVAVVGAAGGTLYVGNLFNARVEGDVVQSFARLGKWGAWLGVTANPAQTPYERAEALAVHVPDGREPIHKLTDWFVWQSYRSAPPAEPANPQAEWAVLRPLLLRHTWRRLWDKVRRQRPREM